MELAKYTKQQCIKWIKAPSVDPVNLNPLSTDKETFKYLLDSCKLLLTPEEISKINPDMSDIIFPSEEKEEIEGVKEVKDVGGTEKPERTERLEGAEKPERLGGTEEIVQFAKFKVPSKIVVNIGTLKEENKPKINAKMYENHTSENDILKLVNNDDFIKKLINSEKMWVSQKKRSYDAIKNGELANYTKLLDKKVKSYSSSAEDQQVIEKRQKMLGVIEKINNICGTSRFYLKKLFYQKIIDFTVSQIHTFDKNCIFVGKTGTGKSYIATVYSALLCGLGVILSENVTCSLSTHNLESVILIDQQLDFQSVVDFVSKYGDLCAIVITRDNDKSFRSMMTMHERVGLMFPHTIYFEDYPEDDLFEIIMYYIEHICVIQKPVLSVDVIDRLKATISNRGLFEFQAHDMIRLAQLISYDNLLVLAQNKEYSTREFDNTLVKFFLNNGKYLKRKYK